MTLLRKLRNRPEPAIEPTETTNSTALIGEAGPPPPDLSKPKPTKKTKSKAKPKARKKAKKKKRLKSD